MDKKTILKMVESGKITAKEADQLWHAFAQTKVIKKHQLVFELCKEDEVKPKFKIIVPIKIANYLNQFISDKVSFFSGDQSFPYQRIDWKQILELASKGEQEEIFYLEYEDEIGKINIIRIYVT